MTAKGWHRFAILLLAGVALHGLTGCLHGISQNPSYFPWLLPTGNIIPTHARPPGQGYYANFDPYAVRLVVRPLSHVNAVQTQHVVVATVYGPGNKPLRNRRVEWYLQGEGNIVQVDESGLFPGRGYQKDGKYAVSHTNYGYHRVTRGNNDPRDDFMLRPGQTWCVLSSAVEGDSYLTVVAPGIHNWDERKMVVNVKWVDAEWVMPEPAQVRTGAQHVFSTRVLRHSDQQPLTNYKVRYRIVDGPPAHFLPNQSQESLVVTDLQGNADITIAQQGPVAGINKVEVEIIRPPDPTKPSGSGVTVVKAFTSVEWLAPKLDLSMSGPQSVPIGADTPYSITITNAGKIESQSMMLTNPIPEGFQFVQSSPFKAFRDGQNLVWTLRPLAPGQTHNIRVDYRAQKTGTVRNCCTLATAEGQKAEQCVVTQVSEPRLRIGVNGPANGQGVVGVPMTFDIKLSNPGSGPANNVILRAELSQGLEPQGLPPGKENTRVVSSRQQPLGPGDSRVIPLTVVPKQAGPQFLRVSTKADGNLHDEAEARVTIAQPKLNVSLFGPTSRYTGRPAEWNITVENPGTVPVNNVMVRDRLPPRLLFQNATEGGINRNGEIVWDLGTVPAGTKRRMQLTTRCTNMPGLVNHRVVVTSPDFALQKDHTATMEIKPVPAALRLEMIDIGDPVRVGKRVVYEIQVTNTGQKPARNVQIRTNLPPEMKATNATARGTASSSQIIGRTVSFAKMPAIQPGQTATFVVEVQALRPGDVRFEAQLFSDLLKGPVTETESTTIIDSADTPLNRLPSGNLPTLPRGVTSLSSPRSNPGGVAPVVPPPLANKQ